MKIIHKGRLLVQPQLSKTLRAMKLIAFIMLTALTQVSASSFSQTVTLRENKVSIEKALKMIASQSGYYFLYDRKDIPKDERITVNLSNVSIDEALDQCLKNQPLSYKIIQQTIVVKRKDAPVSIKVAPIKVKGKVTDNKGVPLPGVGVKVKGTTTGAVTDGNGNYTVNVPEGNNILVFTYLGFKSQEVAIDGKTEINVSLIEDSSALTEVVVVGYGTQKRGNLTAAVSTIDAKDLDDRPVSSVATAMQGLAAGLTVTRETGMPGDEGVGIQIRGSISANPGVETLVVLDGVTVPSVTLQTMNPNDIESISILKDAAAASIYGAQSAGGVIIITTKKGKAGKTVFDYSNNIGTDWGINIPKRLSLYEEALYSNLSRKNAGQGPEYSDVELQRILDGIPYVDHPTDANAYIYYNQESLSDQVLRKTTTTQTHNFSARGGTEKFKFLAGLGYYDKQGIFKVGPDKNERYTLRLNTETQLNKYLSLDTRFSYTLQQQESASTVINGNGRDGGIFYEIYRLRTRTPFFTPEGRLNSAAPKAYALLDQGGYNNFDRNHFDGVFSMKMANFIKGLQIRAIYGANRRYSDRNYFERTITVWNKNNSTLINPTNLYRVNGGAIATNNLQGLVDYDFKVGGKNKFHLLAGYQFEDYRSDDLSTSVQSVLDNDRPALNLGLESTRTASQNIQTYAYQSFLSRFNYIFDDKYIFEATLRVDESTKLAPGLRVKAFPAASAGWNMHMEPWFKNNLSFISQFKIRASWGTQGNAQGIGNYGYLRLLNRGTNLVLGDARATYLSETSIPSINMSWETMESKNLGLDFGLLKGKLQGSAELFVRDNTNMLLPIDVPDVIGITPPRLNQAKLNIKGWELTANYNSKIGKDFAYKVGFNLSDNKNKLVRYEGSTVVRAGANTTVEGYPLRSFFGYRTNGYYTDESQLNQQPYASYNAKTGVGDVRYIDQNGDGTLTPGKNTTSDYGDLQFLGTTDPRYTFGINLGMNWKGIDFTAFFQGVGKRNFMPQQRSLNAQFVSWMQALEVHNNYYTEENPNALYPRPYAGSDHNFLPSDKWFLNGQYIRLKNLQVGYSLPTKLISKVRVSRARVFFTGQDLLTFSKLGKFKGYYDPEMRDNLENDYPFFATAALGLNLTF